MIFKVPKQFYEFISVMSKPEVTAILLVASKSNVLSNALRLFFPLQLDDAAEVRLYSKLYAYNYIRKTHSQKSW